MLGRLVIHTLEVLKSSIPLVLKVIPQYCTAHLVLRIITRNKRMAAFLAGKFVREKNGRFERHGWEKEVEICGKEGKDS